MQIAFFSGKGGTGKTTHVFHLGHALAKNGICTLMVDCDPKCDLTSYCHVTPDQTLYTAVKPVFEGIGDATHVNPVCVRDNLYLLPGDVSLGMFEEKLAATWNKVDFQPAARAAQNALNKAIKSASENAKIVLIDLGSGLKPIPRAVLSACDYFIVPLGCDMFSVTSTETINKWPVKKPEFMGYISSGGATSELEAAVSKNLGTPTLLGVAQDLPELAISSQTEGKPMFELEACPSAVFKLYGNISKHIQTLMG